MCSSRPGVVRRCRSEPFLAKRTEQRFDIRAPGRSRFRGPFSSSGVRLPKAILLRGRGIVLLLLCSRCIDGGFLSPAAHTSLVVLLLTANPIRHLQRRCAGLSPPLPARGAFVACGANVPSSRHRRSLCKTPIHNGGCRPGNSATSFITTKQAPTSWGRRLEVEKKSKIKKKNTTPRDK